MSGHFSIKIPCKPYVKAFLENNCGSPADLTHLPDLLLNFERFLKRKQQYREKDQICNYGETVTVIIPPASFYRYGWEIDKEGIREFNRLVEIRAKFLMRQYVSFNHKLGIPVSTCIKEFQVNFCYPEHIWPYDSIKKDLDRHRSKNDMTGIRDLRTEINKILLYNLSELGTISKKLKKEYANG